MFFAGALAFFVAEIAAFVTVGEQIGFIWAVLLLIGVSALGPFVIRRVGLAILARTQERLARGEVPTREVLDGAVVLAGGLLIMVPGFVSDALGLLLMIGPVRHLLIRAAGVRFARRIQTLDTGRWDTARWDTGPSTVIDIRTRDTTAGGSSPTFESPKELL